MKQVQEYEGLLQEVGPGIDQGNVIRYTYIKIGGKLIRHIYIYKRLHDFFLSQVGNENCKLWIAKQPSMLLIIAIRQLDGQVCRVDLSNLYAGAFLLVLLMGFALYLGPTALLLFLAFAIYPVWLIYSLTSKVRPIKADFEI